MLLIIYEITNSQSIDQENKYVNTILLPTETNIIQILLLNPIYVIKNLFCWSSSTFLSMLYCASPYIMGFINLIKEKGSISYVIVVCIIYKKYNFF